MTWAGRAGRQGRIVGQRAQALARTSTVYELVEPILRINADGSVRRL
jgi:hypothetical protein